MFLSIIIPHYNLQRELLERCIESIVKQEMPSDDYEIIIVDDGSITPPVWVEELYPGTNIRLLNEPHGGPGAARNRGIEEAKGTYIEFVDADDTLVTGNEYKQCLEVLRSDMPEILHFNYRVIPAGNELPDDRKEYQVHFSNIISGARYMRDFNLSGSPCRYFARKELILEKDILFPVNTFHEDEEFNTILHFHARTLVYSDAVLYNYFIREGSTTANSKAEFEEKRINDMLHVIERLFYFRRTQEHCSKTQSEGFSHKFAMLGVDAILNMMYNGMSAKTIVAKCRKHFEPIGLYPLPKAGYSMKYRIFRTLANSKCGMRLLRLFIPSSKPIKR